MAQLLNFFTVAFLIARMLASTTALPKLPNDDPPPSLARVIITPTGRNFKVKLATRDKHFDLKLQKASEFDISTPALAENIKVLVADIHEATGNPVYHRWTPTKENIDSAHNLYYDETTKATFRINTNDKGHHILSGVIDGLTISHNGVHHTVSKHEDPRQIVDYLEIPKNISFPKPESRQSSTSDSIVELLLVCDKEFSDIFGQNYQKVLDYFAVLFWDINLRYKSLTTVNVSWRVVGVVLISNTGGQPFIEQARAGDGRVNHDRTLPLFRDWVYQQRASLPAFDIASAVTNAAQEWGGGLAYVGAACAVDPGAGRNWGTSVWNDNGNWGAKNVIAHELGHNLGAPHDDDPNFPGGCSVGSTYIMGGSSDDHRFYFSSCSSRTIGNFVKSNSASCLRTLSATGNPALSPDFNSPPAPSMTEQCRKSWNPTAVAEGTNCMAATCKWQVGNWYYTAGITPLDNSPCGTNGRCFRSKCRQPGYLLKNVGTGLCMRATDNFNKMAVVQVNPCPAVGTALDRFVVTQGTKGTYLETPYIENGSNSVDKCAWTGSNEGDGIWTDKCGDHTSSNDNAWHGWELRDAGNRQFLLYHKVTGRCAKATRTTGNEIRTYKACDASNPDFKWTRTL